MNFKIVKCLVQGPARVGKTHVKALILKKKLEEGKSPSTNCVEQAVRAVCTEKFAGDDESWKVVGAEELMKMLTKEIKHQHESPSIPTTRKELLAPLPLSVSSDEVATVDSTESIEVDDVKHFVKELKVLIFLLFHGLLLLLLLLLLGLASYCASNALQDIFNSLSCVALKILKIMALFILKIMLIGL